MSYSFEEHEKKLTDLYNIMNQLDIGVKIVDKFDVICEITDIVECGNQLKPLADAVCKACAGAIGVDGEEPQCMVSKDGHALFYIMEDHDFFDDKDFEL